MNALLSKRRLDEIRRRLYGANCRAVFYKITPQAGETPMATITDGFLFVRERRAGQEIDGSGVKFWLASDMVDESLLRVGAAVALTVNNQTLRYKINELLPQQQVGAGYVMRLAPLVGATG